jgi:hypothetical protein
LVKKSGRTFFCISLRTAILSEAMSRAAHLLAVLKREETKIMNNPIYQNTPAEEISLLLSTTLRCELDRILSEQDAGFTLDDDAIEDRISALEQANAELRRSARRNDYSAVEPQLRCAAQAMGINLPDAIPVTLGRRALELFRDLKNVEAGAIDGGDARSLAEPLVARYSDLPVDQFMESRPILLSDAWKRALELYPTKSMKGNIDAIANVRLCPGVFSNRLRQVLILFAVHHACRALWFSPRSSPRTPHVCVQGGVDRSGVRGLCPACPGAILPSLRVPAGRIPSC